MSPVRFVTLIVMSYCILSPALAQSWRELGRVRANQNVSVEVHSVCFPQQGVVLVGSDKGIYRSTNRGVSWNLNTLGSPVWSLLATSTLGVFAGTEYGVYRSTNNGISWYSVVGLPQLFVCRLAANSRGHLFAGAYGYGLERGVFRSTDGGITWDHFLDSVAIEPLFITSSDDLYAGAGNGAGILRSTNGGNSWSTILTGMSIRSITVAPNGNILTGSYSPSWQLWYSTNGGTNWLTPPPPTFFPEYFAVNPAGTIFCATNVGMKRSDDNGLTWSSINNGLININNIVPHLRTLTLAQNGDLYAGEIFTGEIFRSSDQGNSWNRFARVESTITVPARLTSVAVSNSNIFVGSSFDGVYRAMGSGFVRKVNGLTNLEVNAIFIGRTNRVFAACRGIFCSTNNGELWTRFGTPTVIVRAVTQIGTGEVFAGTAAGVLRFTSDGSSFQLVNNGLTNRSVNALVSNAINQVFAGTDGGLFRLDSSLWLPLTNGVGEVRVASLASSGNVLLAGTQDSGAYVSQDNGQHWRQIAFGLSGQSISDVALASPNKAYAATRENGVYASTIDGTSWTRIADGLTDLNITGIESGPDGFLYAVSDSGNIYRSSFVDAVELPGDQRPSDFALHQNYPNPFNPYTVIHYQLPIQNHVTLRVFDILGREIAVLVNKVQEPGFKSVVFRASNLASGVYLYKLEAGNFRSMKRMLVLK